METQTYIECKRNSHGNVLYVYEQSAELNDNPIQIDEIILPESSEGVSSVQTNGKFIVASFVNHGEQRQSGAGAVFVFKKKNDGKFHLIQTITPPIDKFLIENSNTLNFGIDLELTDENLFITCSPNLTKLVDGRDDPVNDHSYIGIYEYGEFFFELVQEFHGIKRSPQDDVIGTEVGNLTNSQDTGGPVFGGINSLAASNSDLIFKGILSPENASGIREGRGFLTAIKLNGTWVINADNPIMHPNWESDNHVSAGLSMQYSDNLDYSKPVINKEWLVYSTFNVLNGSQFEPIIVIYKKDTTGYFKLFQTLNYGEDYATSSGLNCLKVK